MSNNDTQPLGYQVPEEAPYQAYDKPIASNEWWQKEQARLLAAAKWEPEQGPTLEEFDQRVKHDLERRIRELQSKGQADFSTVEEKRAYLEKWGPIAEQQDKQEEQETADKDAREMMQEAYKHIHVHGPFVFLMNQNHNALRGCVTCGATWVGLMAGEAKGLVWHPVGELAEEEEHER